MADWEALLAQVVGFDWDAGNTAKNWIRHRVTRSESEEAFFNQPIVVAEDGKHSRVEPRFALLGRTNGERLLTIIFTIRGTQVRVISARPMSRKERSAYAKAIHEAD